MSQIVWQNDWFISRTTGIVKYLDSCFSVMYLLRCSIRRLWADQRMHKNAECVIWYAQDEEWHCQVLRGVFDRTKAVDRLCHNCPLIFLYFHKKRFFLLPQQSEHKVFCKLICWLGLVCRLTSVVRSPPARRSRRPCYRSAGHCLFNLRMTSSRGRGWSSGFGCEANFVRCWILLSWMTSCTVGMPRSLWII